MEFQQTVWNDLQKAHPKVILKIANIPGSYMWDGIADISILNRLDDFLRSNYVVDQVLLVNRYQGVWASSGGAIPPKASCIYVFKRKD